MSGAMRYRIVVRGELSDRYGPAFERMSMEVAAGHTTLVGDIVDQAQLHGLLERVSALGLELVSVAADGERSAAIVGVGYDRSPSASGAPATPSSGP